MYKVDREAIFIPMTEKISIKHAFFWTNPIELVGAAGIEPATPAV